MKKRIPAIAALLALALFLFPLRAGAVKTPATLDVTDDSETQDYFTMAYGLVRDLDDGEETVFSYSVPESGTAIVILGWCDGTDRSTNALVSEIFRADWAAEENVSITLVDCSRASRMTVQRLMDEADPEYIADRVWYRDDTPVYLPSWYDLLLYGAGTGSWTPCRVLIVTEREGEKVIRLDLQGVDAAQTIKNYLDALAYTDPGTAPDPGETDPTADPAAAAAATSNHSAQNYVRTAQPVRSYLYARADGNLCRVEYTGDRVAVEVYDPAFRLLTASSVPCELPVFGGFYAGESFNFLVFGQDNPEEGEDAEVLRIVKYSRAWERLGQASLRGANTWKPMAAGSLRCAEREGMLYIRTCHEMYAMEGVHHQANAMLALREQDMTVTDVRFSVSPLSSGYVSHSFNQFLLANAAGDLIALDHGDANPRAAVLFRYADTAGYMLFPRTADSRRLAEFPTVTNERILADFPDHAYNFTGAGLGGLEESGDGYLIALNLDRQDGSASQIRNAAVLFQEKSLTEEPALNWISTEYTDTGTVGDLCASVPQLVKLDEDSFLILWEVCRLDEWAQQDYWNVPVPTGEICFRLLNGRGEPQGELYRAAGKLSDCKPILYGGAVVWYAGDGEGPEFYRITRDNAGALTLETTLEEVKLSARRTADGVAAAINDMEAGDLAVCAGYDAKGRMLTADLVVLKAGSNSVSFDVPAGCAEIRIFLLDGNARPLTETFPVQR